MSVLLGLALCATPFIAAAQQVQALLIHPSHIDASSTVAQALETHKGHASTAIDGQGSLLIITYRSDEPLEVYMVPLNERNDFVPTDYVHFSLAPTEEASVAIDLTVSPGWSLQHQKWLINLLSTDENAGAQFSGVQFANASVPAAITAAAHHLMTEDPYTPSSYHALRGYRVLGTSVTVTLGILTLFATFACFAFVPKKRRKSAALTALVCGFLLYQARFSVDLLRYAHEHLIGYGHGIYDEEGSVSTVARTIKTMAQSERTDGEMPSVFVCRDGTNFKEKLLRYFAYPVRVSSEPTDLTGATFAVVMDKFKEGYELVPTTDPDTLRLRCGLIDQLVTKLGQFPDKTLLFRLLPSPSR